MLPDIGKYNFILIILDDIVLSDIRIVRGVLAADKPGIPKDHKIHNGVHVMKKKILTIVSLLCSQLVCNTALAGDPAAGEAAFAAKGCTACHGAGGISSNPAYPSLNGKGAEYIEAQLKAFKSGARQNPTMSPMAAMLSDEEVGHVSAYLGSLK